MVRWRERELTYKTGLKLAKKARSKNAGKRLNARARLKIEGENLELLVDGERIALIHPDDTATVFFPRVRQGRFYGDWLGVEYFNHPSKKRRPAVFHRSAASRGCYWPEMLRRSVPAVDGVRFCLRTGECLNPTPWPERKQTDKAGAWRAKITKLQRTIKVMAKMGAFNHLPQEVWKEGDDMWLQEYPPLTAAELHRLIDQNEPQKLARRLVENFVGFTRLHAARGQVDMGRAAPLHFKNTYNEMRDPVRKIAGCYIEEIPHEQDRAVASAA